METTTQDGLVIVSSDAPPSDAVEPETLPVAPSDEDGTQADSTPAPTETDEEGRPVSPRELRRLMGRLTRRESERDREIEALRVQNETLMRFLQPEPRQPEQPQGPPRRPRAIDFDSDEAYDAAQEKYLNDMVTHRLNERDGQQRMEAQRSQQQAGEAERMSAIHAREQELLKEHPDYYERFEDIGPRLAPQVLWGLQQSGAYGPDLVMHLSQHPQEIDRLNRVPPHLIGVELGMLRTRNGATSSTPPATATPSTTRTASVPPAPQGLPEPPQPVSGGSGAVSQGYRDDMTQQQFDDWSKRNFPGMPFTQKR